jgi:spore germination cell wall hydrolase CwlJ-like protein
MLRSARAGGLAAAVFLASIYGASSAQAQEAPVVHPQVAAPFIHAVVPATKSATYQIQPAPVVPTTAPVARAAVAPGPGASLEELSAALADSEVGDASQECLATAVYFEARGEPLAGQLAVAEVVLNRARSGRYPPDVCAVVKQPAQFSFVRRGQFPLADRASDAWRRAVAISRIASAGLLANLPQSVLWYHADYVAPSWGKRLRRETKIGLHIFYS